MLALLSDLVTLMFSSLNTKLSGGGRKSLTTRTLPIGWSVYLILLFIDFLAFSPISVAYKSDDAVAVGELDRENFGTDPPKAVVALFGLTMLQIFGNDSSWIGKRLLRQLKRDPVLF